MKTYKIGLLFLALNSSAYSQAQMQPVKKIAVNLPTILKLAGANNLTIKQYELQYQLSQAQVDKAREWFLPTIELGPTMHYLNGAAMQTNGSVLSDVTQKELWLGGGFAGSIDFNKGIFDVKAKKQESAAVKFESQAQRNGVILDAISDYYDLMVAQFGYIELRNLSIQADTLTEQIKLQADAGLRYQSEYLLAQTNADHIRFQLADAEVQMQKKSDALLNILNIDTSAMLVSADTGIVPVQIVQGTADTGLMSRYVQNRPEYKSMQAELNSIQTERKTTTVGLLLPKIVVGTPDALLGTFGEPYYNTYTLDAGLLWDIPIGRIIYRGDVKTYNAEINMEQNDMQQFGNEVVQQVADARAQIKLAMQQMDFSRQSLNHASMALEQSIEREKLGTVLPFEVFQSEQFYVQAEDDYLKAVSDYNKAQYQLYVAMGNNL